MLVAAWWGALAAAALLVGTLIVWVLRPSARSIAVVMALGSGVLIASVAYDLVGDALAEATSLAGAVALIAGAGAFVLGARIIERKGGRHRKRPHHEHAVVGSALAIVLGSVLDGIPESFVLGLTVVQGGVSLPLFAGIALSNLPEGMASASGLQRSGWPLRRVLLMWSAVIVAAAIAAAGGFLVLSGADPLVAALVQMFAGGALLAMIVDTMLPEAYQVERNWTGLLVVTGFVVTLAIQAA